MPFASPRAAALFALAATALAATPAALALQPQQHAQVELLADHASVQPGQTVHVGLRIVHDAGWHTYWVNPGDSGLATRLDWTVSAGATVSAPLWPVPERLALGDLTNIGYKDDLLLPATLAVPPDAQPGETLSVALHARWLICADVCIPDEARLTLALPVTAAAAPSAAAERFTAALARVPQADPGWQGTTRRSDAGIVVTVNGSAGSLADVERIEVFPQTAQVVGNTRIDAALDADGVLRFTHAPSDYYAGMPADVDWVIAGFGPGDAMRAFSVRLRGEGADVVAAVAVEGAEAAPGAAVPKAPSLPLALALLFALLGGVILNLMPCVFPVLALKALGFTHGSAHGHRRHALIYTAGVLVAFLALAGLLVALRGAGEALGWGFQLQTPWFVAAMALLMTGLGLALSGLAMPGASLMGLGQSLAAGDSDRAAFFTGVLAVVVASPCTAPFMGPALGFALTQPGAATFAVFAALGLGLALPLLLLGFAPGLAARLPRPGAWMERMKQALAFPMYLTALWLAWVLGRQVGVDGMTLLVAGMLLLAFALWWRGTLPGRPKRLAVAALLLLAVSPVWWIHQLAPSARAQPGETAAAGASWQPWSPARVAELRREGRPVLVNFTAAWCISCLANERVALSGDRFTDALARHDVVYLKADWTDYDADITQALAESGRSGVPLYLVYPAGGGEPELLPQLLTRGTVEAALARAAGS